MWEAGYQVGLITLAQGGRSGLEWTWWEAGVFRVSSGGGVGEALVGHT